MFSKTKTERSTKEYSAAINVPRTALEDADAVVAGAGAGLSASAGFAYSGERSEKYFPDFEKKYGFHDMYTGGFCQFGSMAEYRAFWSRCIYINRYMEPPKPVYSDFLELVKTKTILS